MSAASPRFGFTFVAVSVAHLFVIGFLLVAGARSCARQKPPPLIMPVEFIVAVDDGPEVKDFKPEAAPEPPKPVVKPPPAPEPEPEPVPALVKIPDKKPDKPKVKEPPPKKPDPPPKKPDPPPKKPVEPVKKPFEKGRRITAPNPNPPPANWKPLSQEELARRLALGATPGRRDIMPEGDTLYYEVIRRKLYKAWVQPGSVPRQLKTEVEIRLNRSGDILTRRLLRPSGNTIMDESVMEAVRSVISIEGLTPDFIDRKGGKVTITFELSTGTG
ncbi:MAG: energy transducer TonB [Kiritimatiellia bacterium]